MYEHKHKFYVLCVDQVVLNSYLSKNEVDFGLVLCAHNKQDKANTNENKAEK